MEKYFKVSFRAQLSKFALAFKAESDIDVFWKKGQKIAQSQKVKLSQCQAHFSQTLQIYCNMAFDHPNKCFKSKITKFQIIMYTQKGNKKVGEIHFDVAPYLNLRTKQGKNYQLPLQKCPDPNARLTFSLTASIEHQVDADNISHASGQTVNIQNIVGAQTMTQSSVRQNKEMVPTRDYLQPPQPPKKQQIHKSQSVRDIPTQQTNTSNTIKKLQQENKMIKQKLKNRQKLTKQNDDLRRKIKNEEYDSVINIKQKIDSGRAQIQKLQQTMRRQIILEKQIKGIQEQIFKCKFQIMSAFNYANQNGGGKLLNQMQEACGLKEQ